jgi:hypothetical protein
MVADGKTGFVVSCGDHEAMAERALLLLSDPDLASRIARSGHEQCANYSWEKVREPMDDCISQSGHEETQHRFKSDRFRRQASQNQFDEPRRTSGASCPVLLDLVGTKGLVRINKTTV